MYNINNSISSWKKFFHILQPRCLVTPDHRSKFLINPSTIAASQILCQNALIGTVGLWKDLWWWSNLPFEGREEEQPLKVYKNIVNFLSTFGILSSYDRQLFAVLQVKIQTKPSESLKSGEHLRTTADKSKLSINLLTAYQCFALLLLTYLCNMLSGCNYWWTCFSFLKSWIWNKSSCLRYRT